MLAVSAAGLHAAETSGAAPVPNEKVVGAKPFPNPERFFHTDGSPDYRAFYQERYEYMAEHFFAPANEPEIRNLKDVQFGDAVTAMLWL